MIVNVLHDEQKFIYCGMMRFDVSIAESSCRMLQDVRSLLPSNESAA